MEVRAGCGRGRQDPAWRAPRTAGGCPGRVTAPRPVLGLVCSLYAVVLVGLMSPAQVRSLQKA